MNHEPTQFSLELLARVYRVGEAVRDVVDEAQRQDAPVIDQAML